ncbi:Transmembrane nucleoporin [Neofusicoccum ribis]|uniref:Transmembrane nucleoporin n=1 Tax=Neofusicoccum ribis TaxID=45134 RepID=A0ABR3SLM2_9PEZI
MAPPPPASMPLQQRLLQLAQTLQFAWFGGHLTLLFCTLRYSLSWLTFNYYSRMARFSYRLAFVAAAVTYGIVVYKAYRARVRAGKQGGALSMIADENVQYLIMALIWLSNSLQIPLALCPFAVYSVFHVLTYTRTNLLPVLQPQPPAAEGAKPNQSALSNTIGRFVKEYYDTSMTLVAVLEIALWFRVLGSALIFSRGSWFLLVFYTAFFRARISQSTFVQSAIHQLTARADALVQQQSTPPQARQAWETVKGISKQAFDATDLNKYAGGAAGPKKAQ